MKLQQWRAKIRAVKAVAAHTKVAVRPQTPIVHPIAVRQRQTLTVIVIVAAAVRALTPVVVVVAAAAVSLATVSCLRTNGPALDRLKY